jgi:hypothetical protein
MSNNDKIAKLKEYIKNFVIKELEKDEELEEVSTTATAGIDGTGTGHYDTPRAFASGSAVGHKSPEVGGYKKVNEAITGSNRKELLKIGKEIKDNLFRINPALKKVSDDRLLIRGLANTFMFMRYTPDNANYKNYKKYFPKNFKSSSVQKLANILQNEPETVRKTFFKQIVKESINESYSSIFTEISKAIKANRPDELNAIKDLGEEYDIGRVLYMARTNPKALKKAVDDRVKERKQFIKGKKLKEVTKQEVNALRNLVKGIGNLKKDFSKATYIGDKELRKKDYNKHYETLLDAEKAMVKLMQLFKNKEMLGEGRYHDWRNDESMTPKQKVGKSMREIRDALNELDKTVKMNLKLKTELNMSSQDYWKNTHKALTKISERLVKMANKIGNLK